MIIRYVDNHCSVLHSLSRHYGDIMDAHQMERVFHNRNAKHSQTLQHSILNIRKSATNIFITFSVNNIVLFSSSAGSAGSEKRARRVNVAIKALCGSFERFIRYHLRTHETLSIFNSLTVSINAPTKICKSFIYRIRSFLRKVSRTKNMDVLLERRNEYIAYKRKLEKSKRHSNTRKPYLVRNSQYRSISGTNLVRDAHNLIRIGNVHVVRSSNVRFSSSFFLNISTIHALFLYNMSGIIVPQRKCIHNLASSYSIYLFRRLYLDRSVVHNVCNINKKQRTIVLQICSSPVMAIKHTVFLTYAVCSLSASIIVPHCLLYYVLLRYSHLLFMLRHSLSMTSRLTMNRLCRVVVFRIRKSSSSGVAYSIIPWLYRSHELSSHSHGMYTYVNRHVKCYPDKNKPILRFIIYCITKYAQIFREIFVCFLTMCSTYRIHYMSTFVAFKALCSQHITICSSLLVQGSIEPFKSTHHQIVQQNVQIVNKNRRVLSTSLNIMKYSARNSVSYVLHNIQHKPHATRWYLLYKHRVRRSRRSLRNIRKKFSLRHMWNNMRTYRDVLSDRLCMFRIVCLVNKSTKPFNGCRSSARL